ncbi:MAG: DUF362 domain-containing protein, partial [Candidatus Aenigmatarchaeota archaeon]
MKSKVVFVKVKYEENGVQNAVKKAMKLANWKRYVKGKKIFVKINGISDQLVPGQCTSPWVIDGVLSELRKNLPKAKIYMGDANLAAAEQLNRAAKLWGFYELAEKYDANFINLSEQPLVKTDFKGKVLREMEVPKILLNVDCIVNLPVAKTHCLTTITCCLKNHWGCVTPETKVLLYDGYSQIPIKNMEWKNQKIFCKDSTSKVIAYQKFSNRKVGKVITESGRCVKATYDHQFWTRKGWKELKELKPGEFVAVRPTLEEIEKERFKDRTFLKEKDIEVAVFRYKKRKGQYLFSLKDYQEVIRLRKLGYTSGQISKKLRIKRNIIINWLIGRRKPKILRVVKELKEKNLIPLNYKNPKTIILARFIGHFMSDGTLNSDGFGISFVVTSKEDVVNVLNDLEFLEFNKASVRKIISKRGKVWNIRLTDYKLWSLLVALGAPVGRKTTQPTKIPKWILKGPKNIKREFLGAFLGGDGWEIYKYKYSFRCDRIEFYKARKFLKDGLKLAKDLKKLLKEFGVEVKRIKHKKDYTTKKGLVVEKISLILKQNYKTIYGIACIIGYRYCFFKEMEALLVNQYLKIKEKKIKEIKKRILEMRKNGKSLKEIGIVFGVSEQAIRSILKGSTPLHIFSKTYVFEKWKKEATKKLPHGFVWDKIEKIEKINGKYEVRDLTTLSSSHSFVANGFLVHNCLPRFRHQYHLVANQAIPDVNNFFRKTTFNVVDATICMEGNAPRTGIPLIRDAIFAGHDRVAIDSAVATFFGFNPRKIEHIVNAEKMGLGN